MSRYKQLTVQEAEAILLMAVGDVGDEPSKINSTLSRKDVFDVMFGAVRAIKTNGVVIPAPICRNIQEEFGSIDLPTHQEMLKTLRQIEL